MKDPLAFVGSLSEELNKLYGEFEHDVEGSLVERNVHGEIRYVETWFSDNETNPNCLTLAAIEDESSSVLNIALIIRSLSDDL